jgi:hypothetical protein
MILNQILNSVLFALIIVTVLYLIGAIVYDYQMRLFSKRVNRRRDAVDVLTAQKYDLLRLIGKLFAKLNIDIPEQYILARRPRFEDTLEGITGPERQIVKNFLNQTAQTLYYYAELHEKLVINDEYQSLKRNLGEIDYNFRNAVNLYNADALGYNYWRRFFLYRWISKLRKTIDKELIP